MPGRSGLSMQVQGQVWYFQPDIFDTEERREVMYIPGGDPYSIVKDSVVETKMFFVVAEIGGDQARDLLLHNRVPEIDKDGTNRKPSPVTVKKYKLLMLSGQWDENPQPIVLSQTADGFEVSDLNDGQQRLMALVEASLEQPDIRVRFTFAFDAPIDSKWVLDQGKRRLPGDFFQMAGEKHANALSHAVRMLYAVERMPFQSIGIWRRLELTPKFYTQFLREHMELKQGLGESLKLKMDKKSLVMPHVGAVLWFMMHQEYGLWKTTEFFHGLATGANLDGDDPRKVTREFLAMQWRAKYKWDGFELLAVLIACANSWLMGLQNFVPKQAFNKLSQKQRWPELIKASQLPETILVPGNTPAP